MSIRTRVKAYGMLAPERLYTARGLVKHAGIGHELLRKMRASGKVKPIDCGQQRYYRGEEIIAWIVETIGK